VNLSAIFRRKEKRGESIAKWRTRLSADAVSKAIRLGNKLPVQRYGEIEKYHNHLRWAGELFEGSSSEIEALLDWNLRRLSKFPGFTTFLVGFKEKDDTVDWKQVTSVEIVADFPNVVACVELYRTELTFVAFGNRSFVRPDSPETKAAPRLTAAVRMEDNMNDTQVLKTICRKCGAKMRPTTEDVIVLGDGESDIVKLRCDACNITRFERREDVDKK